MFQPVQVAPFPAAASLPRLKIAFDFCIWFAGQTLQDFAALSADDWASVEVVVKLGGGGSSQAAAKWQAEHKHLQSSNSSSVSLTLPLDVRWRPY